MSFSIVQSLQNLVDKVFSYLPNVFAALVILAIGYLIAKLVKKAINKVLDHFHVDRPLENTRIGGWVERISPGGRASHLLGGLVFWIIFLYVLTAAVGTLQIPAVTAFMNSVLNYLPRAIAAVLIFVVAAAIAAAVATLVQRTMGDTPTGKLVETIVPALVLAIAGFMILTELQIAPSIVIITYAALIGMLALAGALAFGLGGRDIAAQMWQQAYTSGQQRVTQARTDAQLGRQRAQQQVGQYTQSAPSGPSGPSRPGASTPDQFPR